MRIGIDARLWEQTGVGRYIRNLVVNLQKIDKKNEYVLFVRKEDLGNLKSQNQKSQMENCRSEYQVAFNCRTGRVSATSK
jgi:hypothetical protein